MVYELETMTPTEDRGLDVADQPDHMQARYDAGIVRPRQRHPSRYFGCRYSTLPGYPSDKGFSWLVIALLLCISAVAVSRTLAKLQQIRRAAYASLP